MELYEHHFLIILKNTLYTFNVRIENLPNIYRREQIVKSIGSKLGQVEEVEITEPIVLRPAEVWVKSTEAPVEIEFRYDVLQKFCTNCGSLRHSFDVCLHPPNPETESFQLMQIDPVTPNVDSSVDILPSSSDQAPNQPLAVRTTASTSSIQNIPSLSLLKPDSSDKVSPTVLSGGMTIFWDDSVAIKFLSKPALNSTDMYIIDGASTFWCSYIYGNPVKKYCNAMWFSMMSDSNVGFYQDKPCLMLGDFNDIISSDKKKGGPPRSESSFSLFRNMLYVCGLHDLKTTGGKYTWAGIRHSHTVKSKIDRVVANCHWLDMYPTTYVQLLPWIGSDHRPLLLHNELHRRCGYKLFRYDNRWQYHLKVQELVANTWNTHCSTIPPASGIIPLEERQHSELSKEHNGAKRSSSYCL
ncbi:unnamed protein product [Thlaspi arvense]|uniref:Zinc knuckle CX2CX4HX4C domain-containing protein n=1 Tax=Thlaspi arvense TaxID=13288 RepID=A0AAU9T884_THLAR|nr:unnamed protein product [Thlaspi arvense]